MHELSLVEAIIEQTEKELQRAGQEGPVVGIELIIGRLSGVFCDAIRFAFDLLAPGTIVEGAKLSIVEPKAVCRCTTCDRRTEVDELIFQCPACQSDEVAIEGGTELLLQSIELED